MMLGNVGIVISVGSGAVVPVVGGADVVGTVVLGAAVVVGAVVVGGVVVGAVVVGGVVVVVVGSVLVVGGVLVVLGASVLVGAGGAWEPRAAGATASVLSVDSTVLVTTVVLGVAGGRCTASLCINRTIPHSAAVISSAVSTPQPSSAGARRYQGAGGGPDAGVGSAMNAGSSGSVEYAGRS